jgi:hypothetical protein
LLDKPCSAEHSASLTIELCNSPAELSTPWGQARIEVQRLVLNARLAIGRGETENSGKLLYAEAEEVSHA